MKKTKTLAAAFAVIALASASLYAEDIEIPISENKKTEIANGLNAFAGNILVAAPQAATQQNVWADAYIGKLFPSLPPHFGVGISLGGTKMDMTGLKNAATAFEGMINDFVPDSGSSSITDQLKGTVDFGSIPDIFVMPTVSIDARIGGIFLPFDIGISAMMTNPSLFSVDLSDPNSITSMSAPMNFNAFGFNGSADYLTLGIDVRYCVLDGGVILPKVSVGAGYNITKGSFGISSDQSGVDANMNLSFNTQVIYVQAEVSKSIMIATVFGGARALVSNTSTSWAWNIKGTKSLGGNNLIISGEDSGSRNADTTSSTYQDGKWDFSGVQPQLYAGVGFNFLVFQTSLSVCADIRSFMDRTNYEKALWSGAFSFHVKF
ncbi:hypothetical protein [Treponema peruense]|uniref:Uncharacterized protein n=1 Tax=Treponema peruense TaxID=2787628 RepID=A0A7T3RBL2_9SPIR|nr:hypothetical protein [Treponema peruense]QQA00108.1 hypothetical protein IWA51_07415 [Treponema peruense]